MSAATRSPKRHSLDGEGGERLLQYGRAITSSVGLENVVDATLDAVAEIVPGAQVLVCGIERNMVRVLGGRPECTAEAMAAAIPVGSGLVGSAAEERTAIYSPDIRHDQRVSPQSRQRPFSPDDRSFLAVPLIAGDAVVGVMCAISPDVDAFTPGDCARVLALSPTVAAAMRNATLIGRQRSTWHMRRELEAQKALFLSLVSAELREPLSAIADLCTRMRQAGEHETGRLAADALSRGRALAALVEEVLSISVTDAVTFEPVDLRGIAASIGRCAAGPPVMVLSHEARLLRVISHLAPPGSSVEIEEEGREAVLSFADPPESEVLGAMSRLVGGRLRDRGMALPVATAA